MSMRPLCLAALALVCGGIRAQSNKGLFDPTTFRTFNLKFAATDYLQQLIANKPTETYIKADLIVDGRTYKNVGVRGRGGQTWFVGRSTGKLPLKIAMDEFVPGQRLMGRRSIVLGVCYDRSFLREALAFRVMRKYIPAPEANFVKVLTNGVSRGVYLNIETPNKDFLAEWYEDPDGNRYKGLIYANRGPDPNAYKSQRLMSSLRPDSWVDLAKATSRLSLTGPAHEREVPKGIDVDQWHRYFACNAFLTVSDTFPLHNFYMYVDPHHDQLSLIPWDLNYSWRASFPALSPTWLQGVSSPVWLGRYQAHLRTVAEQMDINELKTWIADYHKLILKDLQKETMWFFPTANLVTEADKIVTTMTNMKANALRALGPSQVQFSGHTRVPLQPTAKDTVWISVKATSKASISGVLLHHRSRGYFQEKPMFDDGKHHDGAANDGIWGVSVPPGVYRRYDYYFSARTASAITFHPSRAAFDPYHYSTFSIQRTSAVISEFLASNQTGLKDEKGEREDWIELFNPTATVINLAGMYLSDDLENLKKWKIPAVTLHPGARVIIWADNEPNEGPFHAAFKLAADEDAIYLTDTDGVTLRDYYEYEDQVADISTGRLFDRVAPFVSLKPPSPLQANELSFCGSRQFGPANGPITPIQLGFTGHPRTNSNVSFELGGATANGTFLLLIGLRPDIVPVPQLGVQLRIAGPLLTSLLLKADATGAASLPMTVLNDPKLDGFHLTFQALSIKDQAVVASNGLELRFCK